MGRRLITVASLILLREDCERNRSMTSNAPLGESPPATSSLNRKGKATVRFTRYTRTGRVEFSLVINDLINPVNPVYIL